MTTFCRQEQIALFLIVDPVKCILLQIAPLKTPINSLFDAFRFPHRPYRLPHATSHSSSLTLRPSFSCRFILDLTASHSPLYEWHSSVSLNSHLFFFSLLVSFSFCRTVFCVIETLVIKIFVLSYVGSLRNSGRTVRRNGETGWFGAGSLYIASRLCLLHRTSARLVLRLDSRFHTR